MATHTYTIANEDAYQMYGQSGAYGNSGWFIVGNDDGDDAQGAYRFVNVTIPQATSITVARLYVYVGSKGSGSGSVKFKAYGIDEDNTGEFSGSPMARTKTSAEILKETSLPAAGNYFSFEITSLVQEIIDRGSWSSGNAIGFLFFNDSSPTDLYSFESDADPNAYLEVTWNEPSNSPSQSPSESKSLSPSASPSPSGSLSPSSSVSPSPAPVFKKGVLKVAKPGVNALTNSDVEKFVFHSDYGTLKYFQTGTLSISSYTGKNEDHGEASFAHNLGYYPYVEVYCGTPSGGYEYCPTWNGGASTSWLIDVKVTTTELTVTADISAFDVPPTFEFKYFIFKNDLQL